LNRVVVASTRTALALLVFSIVGTALLAYTYGLTFEPIRQSEEREKVALLAQTLPPNSFDNDLVKDSFELPPDPLLGNEASHAYLAKTRNRPAGIVIETVAPDGYAGRIQLLVGFRPGGEISGVRVTAHKETPGLGDYVDIAKSTWIDIFRNRSLADTPERQWAVRKDGGRFDYHAGATITARAVVRAVHQATQYFEAHRQQLFSGKAPKGNLP
jgi:electron transport complex protein RnfG